MTRYVCRRCLAVIGEEGVNDGETTREDPDFHEVEAGLCDRCYSQTDEALLRRIESNGEEA